MFTEIKGKSIPTIIIDSSFRVVAYSTSAKQILKPLRSRGLIKSIAPSVFWNNAEVSLSKLLPASIVIESDPHLSVSFLPIQNKDVTYYYGVIHPINSSCFDPNTLKVIHDLKAPLNIIRRSAFLLKGEADAEILGIIDRNALRLIHLINNVSDIINDRHTSGRHSQVDISEIFGLIREELFLLLEPTEIDVYFDVQNGLESQCCSEQIERIGMNLISNALKFCRTRIRIQLWSDKEYIYLTVENDGKSISSDEAKKIFIPWYRSEKSDGTGLGLSIANEFARANDGDISLESAPDKTIFTFRLPLSVVPNMLASYRPVQISRRELIRAEFQNAFHCR